MANWGTQQFFIFITLIVWLFIAVWLRGGFTSKNCSSFIKPISIKLRYKTENAAETLAKQDTKETKVIQKQPPPPPPQPPKQKPPPAPKQKPPPPPPKQKPPPPPKQKPPPPPPPPKQKPPPPPPPPKQKQPPQPIVKVTQKSTDPAKSKKKVFLVIGIFSSNWYQHRRDYVRKTWASYCTQDPNCEYKFLLDSLDLDRKELKTDHYLLAKKELQLQKDIVFLETPVGRNFAVRNYEALIHIGKYYDFSYYLRIDDDQYLCYKRLMHELQTSRPRKSLFWGFAHCGPVPKMDEGFMIFTEDLVHKVLEKKNELMCSAFGTGTISHWMYQLNDKGHKVNWFTDNKRIYHNPPVQTVPELLQRKELCHTYISLHGVYKNETMLKMHELVSKETGKFNNVSIVHACPDQGRRASLHELDPYGKAELCRNHPVFRYNLGRPYIGRDGEYNLKHHIV